MTTAGNKKLSNLITDGLAIGEQDAKEAGAVGFMARMLVQTTMPHSKTDAHHYNRINGDITFTMATTKADVGLPYGSIPRLLLAWLTTEAVRTNSRELIMGDSLSDFMRQLSIVSTGGRWGSITRLKDQTTRLFSASVSCYKTTTDKRTQGGGFRIAKNFDLWWTPENPSQKSIWESSVVLDETFFDEITRGPVPIDMRALQALKGSPMALDIYNWLTYRMSYLSRRIEIPWEALQVQFGSEYAETRFFKRAFLEHLKKVLIVYPNANVSDGDHGLRLLPSKTHVKSAKAISK
jgi:hypothetical protein